MRKSHIGIILFVLLAAAALFPGCMRAGSSLNGSGRIIEKDVKVAGFNSVSAQGKFALEIRQGDTHKVTVCTDDNLSNRVKLILDRSTLKLEIEAPASFFPTSLLVKIVMPQISGLYLSGEAAASLEGFKSSQDFNLSLEESSVLKGSLVAGTMVFNVSGASQVVLQGTATKLTLDCKDASKLDLGELALTSAHLKLRGASEATMNVGGEFVVLLSDASKLYYIGNPMFINTYITGGSTMIRKIEAEAESK